MEARQDTAGLHGVAAALLLAAPLCAFLATNDYPIATPEVAMLLAGCAAIGAAFGFIAPRIGTTAAALALGAGAALSLDSAYDLGQSNVWLGLAAAACMLLAWLLRHHIALVLAVAASVFLASTLLMPGNAAGDASPAAGPRDADGGGGKKDLPVLLHLVLDEHIGIDGLPQEMPESRRFARALSDFYVERGFRVFPGAYSEYFDTRNSLANLLNFTSSDGEWTHLAEGETEPYILRRSAYFRHLSELGYSLNVYQSDYLDFCGASRVPIARCVNYSGHDIGPLHRTGLDTSEKARFILGSFVSGSNYVGKARSLYERMRKRGLPLPAWGQTVNRVGPLPVVPVLRRLERDLRAASPGEAFFAHLLIPHYPYVLDEACGVHDDIDRWLYNVPLKTMGDDVLNTGATRQERYRSYFAQIECQQEWLARLFDAIKLAGLWREAIVIVHGDHGSRIMRYWPMLRNADRMTWGDFGDAYSTLFAVKDGKASGSVVPGLRPLQDLLAEVFGLPPPKPQPKVYLRTDDESQLVPRSLALFRREQ